MSEARLFIATEDVAQERDRASWDVWGGGLTPDAFVTQESLLRESAWSRRVRRTWIWGDPTVALASCETYEGSCTLDGRPGRVWAIASVFTDARHRGRGHASALLKALDAKLGSEPGAMALVLYSDIEPAIYQRLGYVPRPAWDRVWSVAPTSLQRVPAFEGRFRYDATPEQVDWHLQRRRIAAQIKGEPLPSSGLPNAPWIDDKAHDGLLLLDLGGDPMAAATAALAAARSAGYRHVRAWETPDWPVGLGERVARTQALPMIRPLDPALAPNLWTRIPRSLWV